MIPIWTFDGEYRFLSNFFILLEPIDIEGVVYTSIEAAYQAAKTLDVEQRQKIALM